MIEILVILLGSLAIWRLIQIFHYESGPANIFGKLRVYVSQRKDGVGSIKEGFYCISCLSLWLALLFSAVYFISTILFIVLTLPLALSAIVILLNTIIDD